jgi:hypothetical protein
MTTEAFMRVRDLVCQLSLQEKLYLLNDLAMQAIQQSTARAPVAELPPLPAFHLDRWPSDLPLRREELYDDRGR